MKKKKETENIDLQVQEKEITQDEIKEEVSVVVNDELIKKLKMLNSVSSEDDKLKEENNEA